jgi:DNA primase
MAIDRLLGSLRKVKSKGKHSWTACCPAHEDRSPSLAIRLVEDGRILLHCFGGCAVDDVLGAVGMDVGELFPETDGRAQIKPAFYLFLLYLIYTKIDIK